MHTELRNFLCSGVLLIVSCDVLHSTAIFTPFGDFYLGSEFLDLLFFLFLSIFGYYEPFIFLNCSFVISLGVTAYREDKQWMPGFCKLKLWQESID